MPSQPGKIDPLWDMIDICRHSPELYFGGRNVRAIHLMLEQIIDNTVNQIELGTCTKLWVILHRNHSITVQDNGPGISVAMYAPYWVSFLELVFTRVAGRYDSQRKIFISTLFHVGLSAVNALSAKLRVTVARSGFIWQQDYHAGI